MIHIILMILKILGLILLSLLGLIILLLLLILFVPIQYRVKGEKQKEIKAKATVSWLFHILHISVCYEDEVVVRVRIFGIVIRKIQSGGAKKTVKPKKKKEKKSKEKQKKQEKIKDIKPDSENESSNETFDTAEENAVEDKEESEMEDVPVEESASEEKEKISFFGKIRIILKKIVDIIRNIKFTIRNVCDKIKEIFGKIGHYLDLIRSDTSKALLSKVKTELGKLFKHILPSKVDADITFGMADPATTGKILGYASMLYPLYAGHIRLNPDFENKIIEGKAVVKGHVTVFVLLRIAIRLYFSKEWKAFRRMLKEESNG